MKDILCSEGLVVFAGDCYRAFVRMVSSIWCPTFEAAVAFLEELPFLLCVTVTEPSA